jgi:hypothetical protein
MGDEPSHSNKTISLDFYIPEIYRGKRILLPEGLPDWPIEPIILSIPNEAVYLDVNPLEDEEEFRGNQDESNRQQLNYYNADSKIISIQDLEHQIITWRLMSRLEQLLKKQY